MAIIDPASEGENYECSLFTWYLNKQDIISFPAGFSSYSRQSLGGSPYKIIWDGGGTNKEHIIQNTENYSYSFIPVGGFIVTGKLEGNGYIQGSRGSYHNNKIFKELVTNGGKQEYKVQGYWELIWLYIKYSDGTLEGMGNMYARCNGCIYRAYLINLVPKSESQSYLIRIEDGDNSFDYPISNKNSVEVLTSGGKIKYVFSQDNLNSEITVNSEGEVSLMCGKDCPPGTCLKCRDLDYVCCYNDQGIVFERVHDPDKEIEAC